MGDDPDIKTRVTPLEDLKPLRGGNDCIVIIYSSDARQFGSISASRSSSLPRCEIEFFSSAEVRAQVIPSPSVGTNTGS